MKIMIVKIKESFDQMLVEVLKENIPMTFDEIIKDCTAGYWGNPKCAPTYVDELRSLTHIVSFDKKNTIVGVFTVNDDSSGQKFRNFTINEVRNKLGPRKYCTDSDLGTRVGFTNIISVPSNGSDYNKIVSKVTSQIENTPNFSFPQNPDSRMPIIVI